MVAFEEAGEILALSFPKGDLLIVHIKQSDDVFPGEGDILKILSSWLRRNCWRWIILLCVR
jgi:hypothetical protein